MDGKCPLSTYADRVNMQEYIYPVNYVKLRYLENHDQDRAKSFIHTQEALMNWTAFIYFQKGMTLIYGGQETENDRTPSLFDKDTVDWNTGYDISGYLSALYAFKKNPILTDSTYSVKAFDGEDILVGMHVSGEKKLVGVFSFKGQKAEVTVELTDGVYTNILNQAAVEVKDGKIYCDGNPIIVEA